MSGELVQTQGVKTDANGNVFVSLAWQPGTDLRAIAAQYTLDQSYADGIIAYNGMDAGQYVNQGGYVESVGVPVSWIRPEFQPRGATLSQPAPFVQGQWAMSTTQATSGAGASSAGPSTTILLLAGAALLLLYAVSGDD